MGLHLNMHEKKHLYLDTDTTDLNLEKKRSPMTGDTATTSKINMYG